jgi:hypothetical protein
MNDQQTSTAEAELLAKLDAGYPVSWVPENEGDTIVGTFIRLETGPTAFGPSLVAILVDQEGNERSVWIFYESLKSGFRRAEPAPGEKIAVRYMGKKPVKNATPGRRSEYHYFQVAVDRPITSEKPVDWSTALGGDTAATSAATAAEPAPDDIPF